MISLHLLIFHRINYGDGNALLPLLIEELPIRRALRDKVACEIENLGQHKMHLIELRKIYTVYFCHLIKRPCYPNFLF